MEYLLAIAIIPWLVFPFKWIRARPELGVAIGLIPSLFIAEDPDDSFSSGVSMSVTTFHSLKIAGFLRPTEVIMILLTLVLIADWKGKGRDLTTPLDRIIGFLLVLFPLAGLLSIVRGADPVYAFGYNMWRSFWWSLIFFAFCVYAIREDRVERVFALFYLGLLARMMYGIIKYLLGFGEAHIRYPGVTVVFWDGLDMYLASCLLLISALLLLGRSNILSRAWLLLGLFASTFTIIFSLRRSPIGNALLALAMLFILFPIKDKRRMVGALASIGLVAIVVLSLATGEGYRAPTDIFVERLGELFSTDVAETDDFHVFDPIDHFIAIMDQPILGLGFGIPFQRTFLFRDSESTFSHNAYLCVWGGSGILGLFAYLALYYRIIAIGKEEFVLAQTPLFIAALISMILAALCQGIYSSVSFTSSRIPFVLAFAMALLIRVRSARLSRGHSGELV